MADSQAKLEINGTSVTYPILKGSVGPDVVDIRKLFGINVKRFREAAGLSQAEIAARMGDDRAYISAIERGLQNATLLSVWEIAQALEVRPVELLAEPDGSAPPSEC